MSGPKFTPGPWSLPHFASPDVNCQCEYVLCDHLMGAIASVHCSGEGDDWAQGGDNPKFEEAVANARLIAAAPEMYEALKALFESYKELADSGDAGFWSLEDTLEGKQALAALSKAEG